MKKYTDIRVLKNRLREKSKSYRESLNPTEKEKLDRKITNRFLNLWQYRDAQLILIYVSTEIEVDTHAIILNALSKGKKVAVPRCVEGTRNIEFYLINSLDELHPGTFDVPEPDPESSEKLPTLRELYVWSRRWFMTQRAIGLVLAKDILTDF